MLMYIGHRPNTEESKGYNTRYDGGHRRLGAALLWIIALAIIALALVGCGSSRTASITGGGYATHGVVMLADSSIITGPLVRSSPDAITIIVGNAEREYRRADVLTIETMTVRNELGQLHDIAAAAESQARATNGILALSGVSILASVVAALLLAQ